jgi:large subunit ribosomal protein L10
MDNPRPEKVAVVDEVRERFDSADAAILTEYRGLKVKDLAELRRSLRVNGGEYKIYKNTLVRFATRELGLHDLDSMLEGPTAIAFVKGDAAAAAKTLRDYSRTNNRLVIKGGVLGDKVLTPADAAALAELPSRDVLLARVAGALAAPLQQFAGLLQALPRNLAFGLAALRDQRIAGGEALPAEAPEPVADAPEPVAEAPVAPEPVAEAAPEPVAEAAPEPVAGDAPEPVADAEEPVAEEPVAEASEPVAEDAPPSEDSSAPAE